MAKHNKPYSPLPLVDTNDFAFTLNGEEEKYHAIVENSVHAFFLATANGTILETNPAASNIFGYTASELKNLKRKDLLDQNDPALLQALQTREKTGFAMVETTGIRKNGERFPVEISSTVFTDTDGETKSSTILSDISLRKQAEVALAESETRLQTIVDTNPECIKLISTDGTVLEVNPAGLEILQADSIDQVTGNKACELILPEYKESYDRMFRNVVAGNNEKIEFRMRGLKGRVLWLQSSAVPYRNSAGEIIGILLVTRDITENKNAEAKLLDSEKRYRYLFENNPASAIIWDINTLEILEVNNTAAELYGYTKDEFLKLTVLDIRPKKDHQKFLDLVEKIKYKEFKKKAMPAQHLTSDGDIIIMEISSHIIEYNGKKAVLALGTDITKKVQLENSLNEERQLRQQQIMEAGITGQEKERTELGQELHDNINQILASSKLYIECAIKNDESRIDLMTESRLLVEKAMFEIRQLSKSLLPPSLGEIGLLQALTEMAENIKHAYNIAITIDWKLEDENKLGSKLKLTIFRILQEQLNNIIKHADAKHVIIRILKKQYLLHISIGDDGVGFDTTQKGKGVGLRNITSRAEVSNGVVFIDSKPGAGCELAVNFAMNY